MPPEGARERARCTGALRRRRSAPRFALATSLALLAASPSARAASPSARLTYVRSIEAASCPDEAALRKAVGARFGYDPFFPWAKQTVVVIIDRQGGQFSSHVQLVDEHGLTRGTRAIQSDDADCAEIFDATALAISIALDALANQAEPPEPVSPSPPAPSPPEPPATAAPSPGPPEETTAQPVAPPQDRRSSSSSRGLRSIVGIDGLGTIGGSPGPSGGGGIFAKIEGAVASVELRFHGETSAAVSSKPIGRVETAHFAATIAPCARFGVLVGCAIGEVGWLRAESLDLEEAQARSLPFLLAGARVGLEIPIQDTFVVRIYVEGGINLDRANYQVDNYPSWTAPIAQGTLAIGIGRKIP